jgi:hypothetical protein
MHTNPFEVSLEGIQRVQDESEWAISADYYSYELKIQQGGVIVGVLLYKKVPVGIYRTELRPSERGSNYFECSTWALTDRWDEHLLAIDAFNLPDPAPKPVTLLDEDVIPAHPKPSALPKDSIL